MPKSNVDYWVPKLRRNVDRDRETDRALKKAGWSIVRVWGHEDIDQAVMRVSGALKEAPRSES